MKRSTAVTVSFLLILGLTALITAIACSSSNDLQPQTAITGASTTTVDTIEYPYEKWDTMYYTRIISYVLGEATSLDYNLLVKFNEEFIEIIDTDNIDFPPLVYVGRWKTDKCTFTIDDNYGIVTVNHKTGFMTIRYGDGKKEIYTH